MTPTPPRLTGVLAKIERAKKHIRDLDSAIQSFRDTDPYGVRTENDSQTGQIIQRIQVRSQVPSTLSLLIGDAVHNLRSALDHLAWQLVEANGDTPTTKTAFPIYKTLAKYTTESTRRVKGMDPAAVNLIDA